MSIKASSLQSLFQLSVALNLGFIAYVTMFGNNLEKEKERVDQLRQIALKYKNMSKGNPKHKDVSAKKLQECIDLRTEIVMALAKINHRTHSRFKPIVLVASLVSLLFLIWTSFFGDEQSSIIIAVASCVVFLPLIFYFLWLGWYSLNSAQKFASRRESLDESISGGLVSASDDDAPNRS
jgi:hypothetical protein